jgi:hypothetical protein
MLDYEKLSQEMGLHHSYLDYIKRNQMDSASKDTLKSFRGGINIGNKYKDSIIKPLISKR